MDANKKSNWTFFIFGVSLILLVISFIIGKTSNYQGFEAIGYFIRIIEIVSLITILLGIIGIIFGVLSLLSVKMYDASKKKVYFKSIIGVILNLAIIIFSIPFVLLLF